MTNLPFKLVREAPLSQADSDAPHVRKHIVELDGLRGIAILMVAAFHFSIVLTMVNGPLKYLRQILVPGWSGVDLFFVLSGFLITGILLDEKGTPSYFGRFYLRRIRRIFPVYYIALALCLVIARPLLIPPESHVGLGIMAAYVFHVSNWLSLRGAEITNLNHLWSLAIEEQFYLCWPLVVYFSSRKNLCRVVLFLIALGPLMRLVILSHGSDSETLRIAYAWTPARVDTLAFGALLAIAVRTLSWREFLLKYSALLSTIFAFLVLICYLLKSRSGSLGAVILYSLLATVYSLVVFRAAEISSNTPRGMRKILRSRALQTAGRYSYAAYVIHFPLLMATLPAYEHSALRTRPSYALAYMIGGIAVTFLLAALSWHCLEKRILALNRPSEKWQGIVAQVAGSAPHRVSSPL